MFQIWFLTWIKEDFKRNRSKPLDPNTSGLHTIKNTYSDPDVAIQTIQIQFQNQWNCNPEDYLAVPLERTLLDIPNQLLQDNVYLFSILLPAWSWDDGAVGGWTCPLLPDSHLLLLPLLWNEPCWVANWVPDKTKEGYLGMKNR